MSRQEIGYGLAPDDKKGDTPRVFAEKCENAFTEIYLYLSGNSSKTTLNKSGLAVSSGGTGAITAKGARDNLGIFEDTNHNLVFGSGAVRLYDDRITPNQSTKTYDFVKESTGTYRIKLAKGFNTNGFSYILPRDPLGNLLCTCTVTFDATTTDAVVKVYNVVYKSNVVTVGTTLTDIPSGRCIDFNFK